MDEVEVLDADPGENCFVCSKAGLAVKCCALFKMKSTVYERGSWCETRGGT